MSAIWTSVIAPCRPERRKVGGELALPPCRSSPGVVCAKIPSTIHQRGRAQEKGREDERRGERRGETDGIHFTRELGEFGTLHGASSRVKPSLDNAVCTQTWSPLFCTWYLVSSSNISRRRQSQPSEGLGCRSPAKTNTTRSSTLSKHLPRIQPKANTKIHDKSSRNTLYA